MPDPQEIHQLVVRWTDRNIPALKGKLPLALTQKSIHSLQNNQETLQTLSKKLAYLRENVEVENRKENRKPASIRMSSSSSSDSDTDTTQRMSVNSEKRAVPPQECGDFPSSSGKGEGDAHDMTMDKSSCSSSDNESISSVESLAPLRAQKGNQGFISPFIDSSDEE